jgi:hypothetical protein
VRGAVALARLGVVVLLATGVAACNGQKASQPVVQHPGVVQHNPQGQSFVNEVTAGAAQVFGTPTGGKPPATVQPIIPASTTLQIACYLGRTKADDGRTIELYVVLGGPWGDLYVISDNFKNQAVSGPGVFSYDPSVPKCPPATRPTPTPTQPQPV